MTRGSSPEVPAIPPKYWIICDGCGVESEEKKEMFYPDYSLPENWTGLISVKRESLHYCGKCSATISVNGIRLTANPLGEDYFK